MNARVDGLGRIAQGAVPGRKKPLRFLTAGSVDDGKSTLIGRLLFDSRAILADQLDSLERQAAGAPIDLALLTDGLEAEREQGITIDVAFRYFATPLRKFIIADAPGHEQYTRNMVTAAAGSDAAVVLVDVTKLHLDRGEGAVAGLVPLLPQTRRHALLAQLLRVPHIVFAVNKLDAVADPAAAFAKVRSALLAFSHEAGIAPAGIVPISALLGHNVTSPWPLAGYDGPPLLALLEGLADEGDANDGPTLMPVQFVADAVSHIQATDGSEHELPGAGHRARVLWGRVARGSVAVGDTLRVFPSGEQARVAELYLAGEIVARVDAGRSAGVMLDRQIDVSRGDWLHRPGSLQPASRFAATLTWLDTEPAVVGRRYWLRHGNFWLQGRITAIESRLDIATLERREAGALAVNDIGEVLFETQQPLPLEAFAAQREAGSLLVVDPATNRTSGALLVKAALDAA